MDLATGRANRGTMVKPPNGPVESVEIAGKMWTFASGLPPICYQCRVKIAEKPVCRYPEHALCSDCNNKVLADRTCAGCGAERVEQELADTLAKDLAWYAENATYGCTEPRCVWEGWYREVADHASNEDAHILPCLFQEYGCQELGSRSDIHRHQDHCPFKHQGETRARERREERAQITMDGHPPQLVKIAGKTWQIARGTPPICHWCRVRIAEKGLCPNLKHAHCTQCEGKLVTDRHCTVCWSPRTVSESVLEEIDKKLAWYTENALYQCVEGGCQWMGHYRELASHMADDDFHHRVSCPFEEYGCQERGSLSVIQSHQGNCAYKESCTLCQHPYPIGGQRQHLDNCPEVPVTYLFTTPSIAWERPNLAREADYNQRVNEKVWTVRAERFQGNQARLAPSLVSRQSSGVGCVYDFGSNTQWSDQDRLMQYYRERYPHAPGMASPHCLFEPLVAQSVSEQEKNFLKVRVAPQEYCGATEQGSRWHALEQRLYGHEHLLPYRSTVASRWEMGVEHHDFVCKKHIIECAFCHQQGELEELEPSTQLHSVAQQQGYHQRSPGEPITYGLTLPEKVWNTALHIQELLFRDPQTGFMMARTIRRAECSGLEQKGGNMLLSNPGDWADSHYQLSEHFREHALEVSQAGSQADTDASKRCKGCLSVSIKPRWTYENSVIDRRSLEIGPHRFVCKKHIIECRKCPQQGEIAALNTHEQREEQEGLCFHPDCKIRYSPGERRRGQCPKMRPFTLAGHQYVTQPRDRVVLFQRLGDTQASHVCLPTGPHELLQWLGGNRVPLNLSIGLVTCGFFHFQLGGEYYQCDFSKSYCGLTSIARDDRRVLRLFCVDAQGHKVCEFSSNRSGCLYSLARPSLSRTSIETATKQLKGQPDSSQLFLIISVASWKTLFGQNIGAEGAELEVVKIRSPRAS